MSADNKPVDFENALAELESLVERLERGDVPLDEALRTFERGVALTRHCQACLQAAQQKVEILLKRSGEPIAFEEAGETSSAGNVDRE
ncbi:MAG: exodeoxyribonuclease VII small subunit [Gammaproteobacteria bacterium]|nr:exodeoxyribonuclease VII small subunit [Gammaproteobacteria bacterium]MBV9726381.1 exodeoxyribonuclease VII small subunit [Gammaproteobacteria bacterium]